MFDHYATANLALRSARREMMSARPDAPVVAPRRKRAPRAVRTRITLATYLRRAASTLEPREATPACR